MLILTRKVNEAVIIDGIIEVKLFAIRDGKVLIGFQAPIEISIHREEVYQRIKDNLISSYNQFNYINKGDK